jgi:FkbM family methyltransferase
MTRRVSKTGLHFLVDDEQEAQFWSWFESPSWEPDTVEAIRLYVGEETACVDVGAWIGDTVLLAASRARSLVAFEPDPVARAALERNLELNPAVDFVTVRGEALSDRNGYAYLRFGDREGDSLTRLAAIRPPGNDDATPVTLLDVRSFLAEQRFQAGDEVFFKLDVEGSEYEIVPAMRKFIAEVRPHLQVSFHPNLRYRKDTLLARVVSGLVVLRKNWRVLQAVRGYRHHLTWDPSAGGFRNDRAADRLRLWLPLPLRWSFLVGTYLFTDQDRGQHRGGESQRGSADGSAR